MKHGDLSFSYIKKKPIAVDQHLSYLDFILIVVRC